jgi:tetratricopeptide (TPR) repeat protein
VSKYGGFLRRAGRFVEAEVLLGDAYRGICAGVGEAHPDARNLVTHWALLLRDEGRLAEASTCFARIRDASATTSGLAHDRTQRSTSELARTLASGGAFDEAVEEVESALAALPVGKKPANALVDAALFVYEARDRASASPANAEAIARWRSIAL